MKQNVCSVPNLFELLDERNITFKTLSEMTGISTENICDWKSGRCSPSIEALKKLSLFLQVTVDYLIGNDFTAIIRSSKGDRKWDTTEDYYRLVDELIETNTFNEPNEANTLNEQSIPPKSKFLFVNRWDSKGNIAMTAAIRIGRGKGVRYVLIGYVALFRGNPKQLNVDFDELFDLLLYAQKNNIRIVFKNEDEM